MHSAAEGGVGFIGEMRNHYLLICAVLGVMQGKDWQPPDIGEIHPEIAVWIDEIDAYRREIEGRRRPMDDEESRQWLCQLLKPET